jgi:hypothetical protein
MAFFGNKRKDFSIQPPRQQVDGTPFFVTDSANIDFTLENLNLTANLTPTGVTAGIYGSSTRIPILQVDQWGRITGVTTTTFSAAGITLETNGTPNPVQTLLNLVAGTNMTITDDGLGNITFDATGGAGSGTVTSVSAGTGMSFTTITTSGAVAIDTTKVPYIAAGFSNGFLKWSGVSWVFDNNTYLTLAAGDLLYYPLVGNPSGFLTASSLTGYVQDTRAINTADSITGGGNLSADRTISLVNDSAVPGINKVYGTNALGVKGWKNDPSGGIPVAAKFYQQDNWSAVGTGNSSVEYVASLNKVYVTNFSSNNVTVLNATTGEPIATVAATACIKCKYVASVNQIYVTSSSATTIIRIDGTTNLPLAAISVGVTVNGVDILEYSSTKVFITCGNASGSIMVVNPLLGTVAATITTSVPAFPAGMALNTNAISLQFDKIIIGAQNGICIFDPSTNAISTTLANPSSAINNAVFLTYSTTDDKYYVSSSVNNRLVILSIATATTFTAVFISNQQGLRSVVVDDANDYLFMFPLWSTGATNIAAKMFKKTTLEPIVTIQPLSQGGAGGVAGLVAIDLANNRIFLVGRATSQGSVSILRYV